MELTLPPRELPEALVKPKLLSVRGCHKLFIFGSNNSNIVDCLDNDKFKKLTIYPNNFKPLQHSVVEYIFNGCSVDGSIIFSFGGSTLEKQHFYQYNMETNTWNTNNNFYKIK